MSFVNRNTVLPSLFTLSVDPNIDSPLGKQIAE